MFGREPNAKSSSNVETVANHQDCSDKVKSKTNRPKVSDYPITNTHISTVQLFLHNDFVSGRTSLYTLRGTNDPWA